jgi:hypothetical protein
MVGKIFGKYFSSHPDNGDFIINRFIQHILWAIRLVNLELNNIV